MFRTTPYQIYWARATGGKYKISSSCVPDTHAAALLPEGIEMAGELGCSEVPSGPGQLLDMQSALPGMSGHLLDLGSALPVVPPSSMETAECGSTPTLPTPSGEATAGAQEFSKPVLHVEVCQRAHSSMGDTKLKEMVLELLAEKGTAFSQLIMEEFEDPVLKEHVLSVSITDTPRELKVR